MKSTRFQKSSLKQLLVFLLVSSLCLLQSLPLQAYEYVSEVIVQQKGSSGIPVVKNHVNPADPSEGPPLEPVPGEEGAEFVSGRLIVKFKDLEDPQEVATAKVRVEKLRAQWGVTGAEPVFRSFLPVWERWRADEKKRFTSREQIGWYWYMDEKDWMPEKEPAGVDAKAQDRIAEKIQQDRRAATVSLEELHLQNVQMLTLPESADVLAAAKQFSMDPAVEYAHPDYIVHLSSVPNDTYADSDQDGVWSSGAWGQSFPDLWGLVNISVEAAWELFSREGRPGYEFAGEGVVVAVSDTGIDYAHEDIAGNVWTNPGEIPNNGVDDDGNNFVDDVHGYDFVNNDGDPMDDHGHGTHVAGTIAAVGNNGRGIVGVAPKAKVMAIKGLNQSGRGAISSLVNGVVYAADLGARVINASWGGAGATPQMLTDAVAYVHNARDVVFVAAAGNSHKDVGTPDSGFYPANIRDVIAVSAFDSTDAKAFFSNFGTKVDVGAPGGGDAQPSASYEPSRSILSLRSSQASSNMTGSGQLEVGTGYLRQAGTSMASPHVAGVAALVRARHPEFTNEEVRSVLKMSADPVSSSVYVGQGRINAFRAVHVDQRPPIVRLDTRGTVSGLIPVRGTSAGGNLSQYVLSYGLGGNPSAWTDFYRSSVPVNNGVLYSDFNTARLDDGLYTLMLVGETAAGDRVESRSFILVDNVDILSPLNNDIRKKGDTIEIKGRIGVPFQSYSIEYGEGRDPTQWHAEGITLTSPGPAAALLEGTLATWDTSVVPKSSSSQGDFYSLRLTVHMEWGDRTGFVYMVYLDEKLKKGWPQYISGLTDYLPMATADLDNDGRKELIVVQPPGLPGKPTILSVYDANGSLRWLRRWDEGYLGGEFAIPVVGDIDGDGVPEIFISITPLSDYFSTKIYAIRPDGSDFGGGWPVVIHSVGCSMLLADLDGHGGKELVVRTAFPIKDLGNGSVAGLYVVDEQGHFRLTVPLPFTPLPSDPPAWAHPQFLAVGNFDDDPEMEIVATYGVSGITVFNTDGSTLPGWPVHVGEALWGPPAVGDIDHDGYDNVVVATFRWDGQVPGGIFALDKDGRTMPGWPVLTDSQFYASPALADLNGDGNLEVSISEGTRVHLLDAQGNALPGWPQPVSPYEPIFSSNVIGDVNGDGKMDVVARAGGFQPVVVQKGNVSTSGGVYAWNLDGSPIDLNESSANFNLFTENPGSSFTGTFYVAPAILDDMDNDGVLDLIASTRTDIKWVTTKQRQTGMTSQWKGRGSLYVWSLGTPYRSSNVPWSTFMHDSQLTGRAPVTVTVNSAPILSPIGDKTIDENVLLDFTLKAVDREGDELTYHATGLPDGAKLDSRTAQFTWTPSYEQAGKYPVRFEVTDGKLSASETITITVRNVNRPPVLKVPKSLEGKEGEPLTLQLSATDADGDRLTYWAVYSPMKWDLPIEFPIVRPGRPLSMPLPSPDSAISDNLATILKSRLPPGSVFDTSSGTFTWTPGYDQAGTYLMRFGVSDGKGGNARGKTLITVQNVNGPPELAPIGNKEVDENQPLIFTVSATDPDGEHISYSVKRLPYGSLPSGASFNTSTKIFRWKPSFSQAGTYWFEFKAKDPGNRVDTEMVKITVNDVNRLPRILSLTSSPVIGRMGRPVHFSVFVIDPDQDVLSYGWDFGDGSVATGKSVSHAYRRSGTYRITLTVSDGKGGIATRTLQKRVVGFPR